MQLPKYLNEEMYLKTRSISRLGQSKSLEKQLNKLIRYKSNIFAKPYPIKEINLALGEAYDYVEYNDCDEHMITILHIISIINMIHC